MPKYTTLQQSAIQKAKLDCCVGREKMVGDSSPFRSPLFFGIIAPFDADREGAIIENALDEATSGASDVEKADVFGRDVVE
jgi:hypothetical protein